MYFDEIKKLREEAVTWRSIAELYNFPSAEAARSWYRRQAESKNDEPGFILKEFWVRDESGSRKYVRDSSQDPDNPWPPESWEKFLALIPPHEDYFEPLDDAGDLMYEIFMPDFHFGLKAWGKETGYGDWDLDIAYKKWFEHLHYHLMRIPEHSVGHVVLTLGNDLIHFDNLVAGKGGATSNGTPQDVDSRWQKVFSLVADVCMESIEMIAQAAPHAHIIVPMIPGNHDYQTNYYLGSVLEARYRDSDRVTVMNAPTTYKCVEFGDCLVMWTHGKDVKDKDLGDLMLATWPEETGSTRHREWHIGHTHQETCMELTNCRVRRSPAGCPPDAWHSQNGYVGRPSGSRAFVWHPSRGLLSIGLYDDPRGR